MDCQTGNFEVGKDFDALRVNVAVPDGPIDLAQNDGPKVHTYTHTHAHTRTHTHTHTDTHTGPCIPCVQTHLHACTLYTHTNCA